MENGLHYTRDNIQTCWHSAYDITHHNRIPQAPTMTTDVEPDDTINADCV